MGLKSGDEDLQTFGDHLVSLETTSVLVFVRAAAWVVVC